MAAREARTSMKEPALLEAPPVTCLELVAHHLALLCGQDRKGQLARQIAVLERTSKTTSNLVDALVGELDPEVTVANWHVATDAARHELMAMPPPRQLPAEGSSMAELRAVCAAVGAVPSNSKVATHVRIAQAVAAFNARRAERIDQLQARIRQPPPVATLKHVTPVMKMRVRAESRGLLSASAAKAQFELTDMDLSSLPCTIAPALVCRSSASMRLYNASDVVEAFAHKYPGRPVPEPQRPRTEGAARTWVDAIPLIDARLAQLGTSRDEVYQVSLHAAELIDECHSKHRVAAVVATAFKCVQRARVLQKALAGVGCTLRSDSRLCRAFIDNGKGNPRDIAITMREMRFYFDHTDYAQRKKAAMDELLRDERQHWGDEYIPCDEMDDLHDEASSTAKSGALQRWVASLPLNEAGEVELPDAAVLPRSLLPQAQHLASHRVAEELRPMQEFARRMRGTHGSRRQ